MKNNILNNKEKIIEFIKNNPSATYKDIRKNTKLHPERIFKGGMAEIYREANIKSPRNFERNTKKKYPRAGLQTILKETKRNPSNFFKNIKEAYHLAGIEYPRKQTYSKTPDEKKEIIIKLIKENPEITWSEIEKITKIRSIHKLFKNFEDIYKKAGIKKITFREKIRIEK